MRAGAVVIVAALAVAAPAHGRSGIRQGGLGRYGLPSPGNSPVALSLPFTSIGTTLPSGVTVTRASSATYLDGSGVLQTVSSNVGRVESAGLLVENSATNVALYSEDHAHAPWSYGSAGTSGATSTIAGAITGKNLQCTGANGGAIQTVTVSSSAGPFTASTWIKPAVAGDTHSMLGGCPDGVAASACTCTAYDTTGASVTCSAATKTGGAATANLCQVSAAIPANGLRLSASFTCGSAGTSAYIGLVPGAGDALGWCSTAGSPSAFYGGMQFEAAGFTTSYIATTGTAASRSADLVTIASPAGEFDGSFSVSLDWKFEGSFSGTSDFPPILSKRPWTASADLGWAIGFAGPTSGKVSPGNQIGVHFADGTAGLDVVSVITSSNAVGSSVHVAVDFVDKTGVRLWLGGALQGSTTCSGVSGFSACSTFTGSAKNTTDTMRIGHDKASPQRQAAGWLKNLCFARREGGCQ